MRHAFACLFAITTTVSMLAAPTADVLRVRDWRAKNEKQILAELFDPRPGLLGLAGIEAELSARRCWAHTGLRPA